jgi:hypothetical protein
LLLRVLPLQTTLQRHSDVLSILSAVNNAEPASRRRSHYFAQPIAVEGRNDIA